MSGRRKRTAPPFDGSLKKSKAKSPTDADWDDQCYICGGEGDLNCCEQCSRVAHSNCLHFNEIPEYWWCPWCTKKPDAKAKKPETKAKKSETKVKKSETKVKKPETKAKKPDAETKKLETNAKKPEADKSNPECEEPATEGEEPATATKYRVGQNREWCTTDIEKLIRQESRWLFNRVDNLECLLGEKKGKEVLVRYHGKGACKRCGQSEDEEGKKLKSCCFKLSLMGKKQNTRSLNSIEYLKAINCEKYCKGCKGLIDKDNFEKQKKRDTWFDRHHQKEMCMICRTKRARNAMLSCDTCDVTAHTTRNKQSCAREPVQDYERCRVRC